MDSQIRDRALLRAFLIGCLLFAIGFFSEGISDKKLKRGFYYWESRASVLNQEEKKALRNLNVERLYVKFFEVGLDGSQRAVPVSKSNISVQSKELKKNAEIIPTVYIENTVFKTISEEGITKLADNIVHLVDKRFSEQFSSFKKYIELQIDCDWTISTKDNYHQFLRILKSKLKCQLSATLRLYPFKFQKEMGVLPVDRAMLMCYNLISPLKFKHSNSILEVEELKKYLEGSKDYPCPLDVALPVFNNVLVYKSNEFVGMVHLSEPQIKSISTPQSKFWRLVTKDTVMEQVTFERGDKIKFEKVSDKELRSCIEVLNANVYFRENATISFFQLNDNQVNDYGIQKINTYYSLLTGK